MSDNHSDNPPSLNSDTIGNDEPLNFAKMAQRESTSEAKARPSPPPSSQSSSKPAPPPSFNPAKMAQAQSIPSTSTTKNTTPGNSSKTGASPPPSFNPAKMAQNASIPVPQDTPSKPLEASNDQEGFVKAPIHAAPSHFQKMSQAPREHLDSTALQGLRSGGIALVPFVLLVTYIATQLQDPWLTYALGANFSLIDGAIYLLFAAIVTGLPLAALLGSFQRLCFIGEALLFSFIYGIVICAALTWLAPSLGNNFTNLAYIQGYIVSFGVLTSLVEKLLFRR